MQENEQKLPHIDITDRAFDQFQLIQENDFTLEGKSIRLSIDGKGCGGFDYALGFDEKKEGDQILKLVKNGQSLELLVDAFASFYAQEGLIDFILDTERDTDGFIFENKNEKNFRGKFFKDESQTPSFS